MLYINISSGQGGPLFIIAAVGADFISLMTDGARHRSGGPLGRIPRFYELRCTCTVFNDFVPEFVCISEAVRFDISNYQKSCAEVVSVVEVYSEITVTGREMLKFWRPQKFRFLPF